MLFGGECLRNDVVSMPFAGALPHYRRARSSGAHIGGAAKVMCFRATPLLAVHNTLTPPLSMPGDLARRFWEDAPVNDVPATSLCRHSQPIHMARHQTLRRAMASTSAKMPRRLKDQLFQRAVKCRNADTIYFGARPPRAAFSQ